MNRTYDGLYSLLEAESDARDFFEELPEYVQDQIAQRAKGINSFESLVDYAQNLTRGDD